MVASTEVAPARAVRPRRSVRSALVTALLVLPASAWYLILLVTPLVIVVVMSFGNKGKFGGYEPGFTLVNYADALDPNRITPFVTSLVLALSGTFLCLLTALPIAYFIATRGGRHKSLFIVLLIVPFWTSFLIRTYAWMFILRTEGLLNLVLVGSGILHHPVELLYTQTAVLIGLVYGELPFMILPLYASLEKLDRSLLEAAADLGAGGAASFRRVTLPLTLPGLAAGVVLVFVPSLGQFVVSDLLGGARSMLLGNLIQNQFAVARNQPFGSALAFELMAAVLALLLAYAVYARRRGGEELL
jgi:spermidine/putrescine transport system permease protein